MERLAFGLLLLILPLAYCHEEPSVPRGLPDCLPLCQGSEVLCSSKAFFYRGHGAAKMVAVTLGKDGGFLADDDGIYRVPAPKIEALSAVGAGESFLAGMVQALSEGQTPRAAFRVGMAAGAAACLNIGTQLCHKADVDRLLAEMAQ